MNSPPGLSDARCVVEDNDYTQVLVVEDFAERSDPIAWIDARRDALHAELQTHGAILLRGLPVDVEAFGAAVSVLGGATLEYSERSTPRSRVAGNVYTSTEYPADQVIPMHNENSYSDQWPQRLFFFCQTPPATYGATPVADSRAMARLVPAEVRERFADGVTYARTLRDDLGLSWQDAFQTSNPAAVEAYCDEHGMSLRWIDDGLHIRHHRPAMRDEPVTGVPVWFNQANLFHVSSLDAEVREALVELYGENELPRNAYYGDASVIPDDDIAQVQQAYATAAVAIPWQAGDVLVVENMLTAHGRQAFSGDRRILVAMT